MQCASLAEHVNLSKLRSRSQTVFGLSKGVCGCVVGLLAPWLCHCVGLDPDVVCWDGPGPCGLGGLTFCRNCCCGKRGRDCWKFGFLG